jgi:hypothetical protein
MGFEASVVTRIAEKNIAQHVSRIKSHNKYERDRAKRKLAGTESILQA